MSDKVVVERELLEELLLHFGDTPCRLDHHGYCQEHWLTDDCIVPRLREALESNTTETEQELW